MRETSPLTVDVSELLAHPGSSRRLAFRAKMEGLSLTLARADDDAQLEMDLRLDALVEGIHVSGTATGLFSLECRRCLGGFERGIETHVSGVYLYPGDATSDDTYVVAGETLELEPLIRDEVLLALPLHPLCREDCAGLCSVCGADRNQTDCGHSGESTDVRWGPLEGLRKQMEG